MGKAFLYECDLYKGWLSCSNGPKADCRHKYGNALLSKMSLLYYSAFPYLELKEPNTVDTKQ